MSKISDIEIWGKIPVETAKQIDKVEGLPLNFVTHAIQCQDGKYYLKPSAIYRVHNVSISDDMNDSGFGEWINNEFNDMFSMGLYRVPDEIKCDKKFSPLIQCFMSPKYDKNDHVYYVMPHSNLGFVISSEDIKEMLCCKTRDLYDLPFVCSKEMFSCLCYLHSLTICMLYKYECIQGHTNTKYVQWLSNMIKQGYANNVEWLKHKFGSTMQVYGIIQHGTTTTLYIEPLNKDTYLVLENKCNCSLSIKTIGGRR